VGPTVSGSGVFIASKGSAYVSVSGNYIYPDVTLTFSSNLYKDVNYSATFIDRNMIQGKLNGLGFVNTTLQLHRD
jgi:hypothetical protein